MNSLCIHFLLILGLFASEFLITIPVTNWNPQHWKEMVRETDEIIFQMQMPQCCMDSLWVFHALRSNSYFYTKWSSSEKPSPKHYWFRRQFKFLVEPNQRKLGQCRESSHYIDFRIKSYHGLLEWGFWPGYMVSEGDTSPLIISASWVPVTVR